MVDTNEIQLEKIVEEKRLVEEELAFAHTKLNQVKFEGDVVAKKKNQVLEALKIESAAVKDLEKERDKTKYKIKLLS